MDGDESFGSGMEGCLEARLGVVRVAVGVSGIEELTWGGCLEVIDGSVSCYGGHPVVLRLWVSLLLCLHWLWHCSGWTPGNSDSRYWLFSRLAIGGRH